MRLPPCMPLWWKEYLDLLTGLPLRRRLMQILHGAPSNEAMPARVSFLVVSSQRHQRHLLLLWKMCVHLQQRMAINGSLSSNALATGCHKTP